MFFNNKPMSRLDEISIYDLVLGFDSNGAGKEGGGSYNNFALYASNAQCGTGPSSPKKPLGLKPASQQWKQ